MARQVWVTVTLDEKVSVAQLKRPQHLFRMSGEMMESLTRMAAEERVEVLDPWWVHPGEHSRFHEAPALEFLEQHLFRYDKRQYRKEQEEVQIFQAGKSERRDGGDRQKDPPAGEDKRLPIWRFCGDHRRYDNVRKLCQTGDGAVQDSLLYR